MKAPIAKAARSAFEKELFALWPFFQKKTDEPLPQVCRLYHSVAKQVSFFVMFQTHRYEDSFTIEIGWSMNGVRPLLFLTQAPVPEGATAYEGYRFRLPRLWDATDMWWQAEDVAAARSAVSDSLERLRAFGGPYLRDVAACLGVSFGPSEKVR